MRHHTRPTQAEKLGCNISGQYRNALGQADTGLIRGDVIFVTPILLF